MNIIIKAFYICLTTFLFACNDNPSPTIAPDPGIDPEIPAGTELVTIDCSTTYQTIESFSASDCWMVNYIGKHWDQSEKEGMTKLLFSKGMKNGSPEGIGLSGWRFNLGGGTANQGSASDINDPSRRAESFMNPADGTLDWTQASGQQFFLDQAKSYGCEQFVMFSASPPVYLTRNGKGYSSGGSNSNLKSDCYDDFAEYIGNVLAYFKNNKGITFDYISPVNEPQHNWDAPSQEGTPWHNSEIKKLAGEINNSLDSRGLSTKILVAESSSWADLYEGNNDRSNVIYNLFDPASANYVGGLSHVEPVVACHSYWTDGNWNTLVDTRSKVALKANAAGLKVYQTEWSMLGDGYDENEFVGYDDATYMDIALYMSKVIHCDLTYANVSSWSYWTSIDMERWNHKNRFLLIKAAQAGGESGDITQSGSHQATKTLWVLGNYSLFVRPNYTRVAVQLDDESSKLFGSAYVSPDGKTVVGVYTNLSDVEYDVCANLGDGTVVKSIRSYTTSETQNLIEKTVATATTAIPLKSKSVVTVVYKL